MNDETHRQVVRLRTSYWSGKRGLVMQRSLTTLRRHSSGHQILDEDVSAIGAEDTWGAITNVNECEDGIYEVITCNHSRDYESGEIDGYEFALIPYDPDTNLYQLVGDRAAL